MTEANPARVRSKIAQLWPGHDPDEIMAMLRVYGSKLNERERDRVHLAILKLSKGRKDQLSGLVRLAAVDYRDVLAPAEFPEESSLGPRKMSELSPEEAEAVRRRDREQYLNWFEG